VDGCRIEEENPMSEEVDPNWPPPTPKSSDKLDSPATEPSESRVDTSLEQARRQRDIAAWSEQADGARAEDWDTQFGPSRGCPTTPIPVVAVLPPDDKIYSTIGILTRSWPWWPSWYRRL
jgi:hypothetical protein